MDIFHMSDIIPLLGLPYPPYGRSAYNISCPCCDDNPRKKHLNINLKKDVFRCPRCGFCGGVFDLYKNLGSRLLSKRFLIVRLLMWTAGMKPIKHCSRNYRWPLIIGRIYTIEGYLMR